MSPRRVAIGHVRRQGPGNSRAPPGTQRAAHPPADRPPPAPASPAPADAARTPHGPPEDGHRARPLSTGADCAALPPGTRAAPPRQAAAGQAADGAPPAHLEKDDATQPAGPHPRSRQIVSPRDRPKEHSQLHIRLRSEGRRAAGLPATNRDGDEPTPPHPQRPPAGESWDVERG